MGATQLGLYNLAIRLLGETKLATLADDREIRYKLDDVWGENLVNYVLEQGMWYFAMRAAQLNADPNLSPPPFGMTKAFTKPSDWVRTAAICSDPYYNVPITSFADEAGFWFADTDPIYIRYISNDANYGNNLGIWPATFEKFVGAHMAWEVAPGITTSKEKVADIAKTRHGLLIDARSKAAMNESAAFPPMGSWVRARFGSTRFTDFDRGSQNSLIG